MENFLSFGLPKEIMASLEKMQFNTPTPIQVQAIPIALEGKDILGSAQTGTGKTAAFGLPLLTKLIENPRSSALVVTPTRELAVQVMKWFEQVLQGINGIKLALLIGGEPIPKQLNQLKMRPRLIIGTPGRINDHLIRGSLMLHDTNFLVLDETDRMLDMGFAPQIEQIAKYLPQKRQTLLFSATMPKNIMSMAAKYQQDPVRISVGSTIAPAANLKQETLHVSEEDKYNKLVAELEKREGSVIVFVKTKIGAEKMATKLRREKHSADAIHGDLRYNKREHVIRAFRESKYRIMVATDIAARGLDIDHVRHVINYDLPQCPEDYIHRIGRTARAGAEGSSICFITPADRSKWSAINRMLNPDLKPDHIKNDTPRKKSNAPKRPFGFSKHRKGGDNQQRSNFTKRPSSVA